MSELSSFQSQASISRSGQDRGSSQQVRRRARPKGGDPLVRPKAKSAKVARTSTLNSGVAQPADAPTGSGGKASSELESSLAKPPDRSQQNAASGFSSTPRAPFQDFDLILSTKPLVDGYRHHVARFQSRDKKIDPSDTNEFVRPVRLQRRDPRQIPLGTVASIKSEDTAMPDIQNVRISEKSRLAAMKAERDARRQAEQALVAPASSTGQHRKLAANVKKTEQVFRNDLTEEQKARNKLRYEEALPWHLEDFDNKNTWVGSYEAALSETYAMMVRGPDGAFRIMPLEKWYKFTQKHPFKSLSIEEAEMQYNKKIKEPRWFMDSQAAKQRSQEESDSKKASRGLFIGKWERGGAPNGAAAPVIKQETADADDLDFQEDRFADDEENMLFEEDEETKEAEARIKRDQLQANIFDLKEEKEYEKQERLEKRERDDEKKLGKRVKKALMKREKNFIYDSDTSDNPFSDASASESSSSEIERRKAEESAARSQASDVASLNGEKRAASVSGRSSKPASGTSTPAGRLSKHDKNRNLSRTASSNALHRLGSPIASDLSGNESSRKTSKKTKTLLSAPASSSQLLQPPSRKGTPSIPPSGSLGLSTSNSFTAKRSRAGSGSDTEGHVGSGAEMSDGTRKKPKITLKFGSREASPSGTRASSPIEHVGSVDTTRVSSNVPSRINSPALSQSTNSSTAKFPTNEEVRSRIPTSGISIPDLLAFFRPRVVGPDGNKAFTQIMKANARFDKETKKLFPI